MEETVVDLIGDETDETLIGGSGPEVIQGQGGDDILTGNEGNDTLFGGEGDDVLDGGLPSGFSNGGFANGDDSLDGGPGNDTLRTEISDFGDTLRGGEGNDLLIGATSTDTSTFIVDNFSTDVAQNVSVNSILDYRETGATSAAEVIAGAIFFRDDLLLPSPNGALFQLDTNTSADIAYDTAIRLALNKNILIGAPTPGQTLTPANTGPIETLIGGVADDTITGGFFPNDLQGGDGDDSIRSVAAFGDITDTLAGGGGNDILIGANRNDLLLGGAGGDFLFGGDGRDTLDGGAGSNVLSGSEDRTSFGLDGEEDRFIVGTSSEFTLIRGFEVGIDVLDLTDFGLGTASSASEILALGDQQTHGFLINDEIGAGREIFILGAVVGPLPDQADEILPATPFDDNLEGLDGDDILIGLEGNDTLDGGPGEDVLDGGPGDDELTGGLDNDIIDGDAGNDLIIYTIGDGVDDINGGADTDTFGLIGTDDADEVFLGRFGDVQITDPNTRLTPENIEEYQFLLEDGNDVFSSDFDGDSTISGGEGNDTLRGGFGDDFIIGGLGFDQISWVVGDGNDTLDAVGEGETPPEDGEFVRLFGDDGVNDILGLQGPEEFFAEIAFSSEQADSGLIATTIVGDFVEIDARGGADRIDIVSARSEQFRLNGGAGNDTILASDQDDEVIGGAGEDDITGAGGNDTLTGGAGSDLFIFEDGFGEDEITDFRSNDFVFYSLTGDPEVTYTVVGPDTVATFEGINDIVVFRGLTFQELDGNGRSGAPIARDDIFTVAENGSITGNVLADNVLGADVDPDGDALSIAQVNGDTAAVGRQITLDDGGVVTVEANGSLTFQTNGAFDALNTGETVEVTFTYVITDGVQSDEGEVRITVEGADGVSAPVPPVGGGLTGTTGPDEITGTTGSDEISGGGGADTLSGGGGGDQISGGGGGDQISGGGGRDTLEGNGGRDVINGNGGRDVISGGGGRDELNGGGGRDLVQGDGGRDFANGDGGRDTVDGGRGRDVIDGGRGADELIGGAGRDTFAFATGSGRDTITDYVDGQDRLSIGDGAESFADLTITQAGDDALIRFSNVRITVNDTDADVFGANDFIFS